MKAFKTFSQFPAQTWPHPDVPTDWPSQILECDVSQQSYYESLGFTVLSGVDFDSYLSARQASYDAWLAIYEAWLDTQQSHLLFSVAKWRLFTFNLIDKVKAYNMQNSAGVAQGLWLHHRLRYFSVTIQQSHVDDFPQLESLLGVTLALDLINMMATGDVESVYILLSIIDLDDMTEDYHCIDQNLINFAKGEIEAFMGW